MTRGADTIQGAAETQDMLQAALKDLWTRDLSRVSAGRD
jgi:hypothetical protein